LADNDGENEMIRKAKAVWRGTGRDGGGTVSTDSGVLADTPYSFSTRFENGKGTNPEELIAAAHAGCFSMTMAFILQGAGFTPTEIAVDAAVTIEPEGEGRLWHCVPRFQSWTRLCLLKWSVAPKRTARFPKSLTLRSLWTHS
jgi:organic hydroperoxide reductase OsmC/OhrA